MQRANFTYQLEKLPYSLSKIYHLTLRFSLSGRQGSNLRPSHPKCDALPPALRPVYSFLYLVKGKTKYTR